MNNSGYLWFGCIDSMYFASVAPPSGLQVGNTKWFAAFRPVAPHVVPVSSCLIMSSPVSGSKSTQAIGVPQQVQAKVGKGKFSKQRVSTLK